MADRLRGERLRQRLEDGRASGLLSEEGDEVTLAWREIKHPPEGR